MNEPLSKELLDEIIESVKADADSPLRKAISVTGDVTEDDIIDKTHECDDTCEHMKIPPKLLSIIMEKQKRLANLQKRGGKKKKK